MNTLRIKNLKKEFEDKTLFDGTAGFLLKKGEKVALIGQNGTGKTTLIKCIVGEEDFEGIIEVDSTVSVMEQEKTFEKTDKTFTEYLEDRRQVVEELKRKAEEKIGDPTIYEDSDKLQKVLQDYELLSRRVTEKIEEGKIRKILADLKFEMEDYDKKITSLSGGQKTKLRIAECLARSADFFILDEPTNHLDFSTLRWLEKKIQSLETVLVISHDRYFLRNVATRIIEIECNSFKNYPGDYSWYEVERKKHVESLEHKYHYVTKERKRLLDSAKEKRQWAVINQNKNYIVQAKALERRAEELGVVPSPDDLSKEFKLHFRTKENSGRGIFIVENVSKKFGNHEVFDNVNFNVVKGDKIAIIGDNGVGKSTLLKILNNSIEPDQGRIEHGFKINIGYFDQEFEDLRKDQKLMEFFEENFLNLQMNQAIALAIKYGFPKEKLKSKIKDLSGGEKARLNLVRLMANNHDVLLLDEPTNNLDIELVKALENCLKEFKGTVVFVSHDRSFIDNVATKLLVIENQKVEERKGNYSQNFYYQNP